MNKTPVVCENCGGELTMVSRGTYKCKQCGNYCYDTYQTIRNFLDANGPSQITVIARETGIPRKTIEYFLGITREDTYTGGELISVYHDYLTSHDYNLYHMLLLHNSDDMKGMLEILPILSYYDLFNNSIKARKVQANYYNDIHGIPRKELLMKLVFASPLPVTISTMAKGCHFKGEGHEGTLIIPIYEEELKYYYANFKDYYYLPTEDTAIHKSIASFVDKEYREQATASTCYTRKFSSFLPQWDILVEPFFKREYKSNELFFELTDEIKKDRQLFSDYASHVLNVMAVQP